MDNKAEGTPQPSSLVADIFRKADEAGNMVDFLPLFVQAVNIMSDLDFARLEKIFREFGFKTHLLAIPADKVNIFIPDSAIVDPIDHINYRDSAVLVCQEDGDKFAELMKEFSIVFDPKANLAELEKSGILMQKSRTDQFRSTSSFLLDYQAFFPVAKVNNFNHRL